jgi:hypothetical protein
MDNPMSERPVVIVAYLTLLARVFVVASPVLLQVCVGGEGAWGCARARVWWVSVVTPPPTVGAWRALTWAPLPSNVTCALVVFGPVFGVATCFPCSHGWLCRLGSARVPSLVFVRLGARAQLGKLLFASEPLCAPVLPHVGGGGRGSAGCRGPRAPLHGRLHLFRGGAQLD